MSWPSSPAISFLSISCASDFQKKFGLVLTPLDTRLDSEISTLRCCHSFSLVVVVESTNRADKKKGTKIFLAWQAHHHHPIVDILRSLHGPEIGNRNRENDAGSQAMAGRRRMTSAQCPF